MSHAPRRQPALPLLPVVFLSLLVALFAAAALASSAHAGTGYVANNGKGTVTPFNTDTFVAGTPITVGSKPNQIAVTPDGRTAYVTNGGSNSVTPIDVATGAPGTPIAVGSSPNAIAITPDGKFAYVANEGGSSVTPINLTTKTAGTPIAVASPNSIAITPDGTKAYVTNVGAKSVTPITLATNKTGSAIGVGKEPRGIAITPDGKTAFVANYGSNSVTPITVATNSPGAAIAADQKPYGVAISPNGAKVFVTSFAQYTLLRIDATAPYATSPLVPLGGPPTWLAFAEDGTTAFVSMTNSGIRPIDATTATAVGSYIFTNTPNGIAIAPEIVPAGTAGAPTGLATSAGDNQMQLSWTAPASDGGAGIDHYVIVPRLGGVDQAPIATPDASTSFTVPGLTNGQTYSFRVGAVNANGRGRFSLRVSKRLPTVPVAPTKVLAADGDGLAQLSWTAPADDGGAAIDHYEVVVSHEGVDQPPIATPTAATSFTVSGLTNGADYSFTVAAVNYKGRGTASSPVTVHLPTPPSAPTDLHAATADSQVNLTWSPPSDTGGSPVIGYAVTEHSGETETTTLVRGITHKFITGLTNGESYSFTVAAITNRYTGAASDTLEVDLPLLPERPAWQASPHLIGLVTGDVYYPSEGVAKPTVTPFDVATGVVGPRLNLPARIRGIAVASASHVAWVAAGAPGANPGSVTPIDLTYLKALPPIPVGKEPWGVAVSPDESIVLVSNRASNSVTPIDTATMQAGAPIPVGSSPQAIAFTPDGATALVVNNGSASVTPIDLTTMTAKAQIPLPVNSPWGIAISPDGSKAYVSSDTSQGLLAPIDLTTMSAGAPIHVAAYGRGVAFAPDGKTAYVVNLGPDNMTPIDVATDQTRSSIPVGSGWNPTNIAISADGATAIVTDEGGGITTVDLASRASAKRLGFNEGSSASVALSSTESLGMASSPAISTEADQLAADLGDPTNPTIAVKVGQFEVDPSDLTVSVVASSNPAVANVAGVSVAGSGTTRAVSVTPGTPGTTTITLKVTGPDGQSAEASFDYGLTAAPSTSATTRWHTGAADASTVVNVGDGYMIVGNDENNTLRMYRRDASGPPVKTWNFDAQMNATEEVDIEASARLGNTIYWSGSHGNSKTGKNRPMRQQLFTTEISGSGASTELTFGGYYRDLKSDLIAWDQANGNPLGLTDASPGVPKRIGGFNIEGLAFAPGSTHTAYVGFRAPLEPAVAGGKALVVPVTNIDELPQANGVSTDSEGNKTVVATFGKPIFWDLGGLSVREIKKNADDEYLIIAGSFQAGGRFALYEWDGVPAHQPVPLQTELPETDAFGEDPGSWEGIVDVPDPVATGADVQLMMDNGSTDFFGNGQEAKTLPVGWQKSRSDHFALGAPGALPHLISGPTISGQSKFGSQLTCSPGEWAGTPAPTFTYRWQRYGVDIEGAVNATYTTVTTDIGKTLRCVVTATNTFATASASSNGVIPGSAITLSCIGSSIAGQGPSVLAPAHGLWASAFSAQICPGGPSVSYEAVDGSGGMSEWNHDGQRGSINTDLAFVGGDQAPNAEQIANIKSVANGAQVAVIPVAQTSIAIVANPPGECEIEAITNADLTAVFEGRYLTWSKLSTAEGSGCSTPITRVVRRDGSGTTTQFKNYLFQISNKGLACTEGETEGKASWAELERISDPNSGEPNTRWPQTCDTKTLSAVVHPTTTGGAAVTKMVSATRGRIGFAALPDAKANLSGSGAILMLQNNGQKKGGDANFADPATGSGANCDAITYKVPKINGGLNLDWSGVFGAKPAAGGESYPLCMLTYTLALQGYELAGFTVDQELSVRDYLHSHVVQASGQAALDANHYSALPSSYQEQFDVLGAARRATGAISR